MICYDWDRRESNIIELFIASRERSIIDPVHHYTLIFSEITTMDENVRNRKGNV